jgi:autotransporter-associated beta strand protein
MAVRVLQGTVLSAMLVVAAFADVQTNTWISGSTDWNATASYLENRVPSAGDAVVIPSGVTATVSVVSTEAANTEGSSFDVFSKLGRVLTADATASVVLDIAEGASVTNYCFLIGKTTGHGTIIKRGLGMIEFGNGSSAYGYNLDLLVEEGTLVLPQNIQDNNGLNLCKVTVNEGATLVTAEDAAHNTGLSYGHTRVFELWGGGTLTNRYGSNRFNFRSGGRVFEFSGRIMAGIRLNISEAVTLMLTGEGSTVSPEIGGRATLGFKKFGMTGEPSSMGKSGVLFRGDSGTVLYLGEGETSDKYFLSWCNGNVDHTIDAGVTGGLNLTGEIGCYVPVNLNEVRGMKRLVLTGSNTVPCVFRGTLPTWTIQSTNYNWHVTKKGAGTWRFADKSHTHAGGWTVEDGVLQFESLKQKGAACSLGTSTNLMENYGGIINESKRVDWAFALGGATTSGKMEYVGTNDATCSTRPLVLKGMGGTFASSSNAVMRFYGASAAAGVDAALTLAGDATAVTNVIGSVSDGAGKMSVVKDGDGTWSLFGTNSFTGSLAVKKGTLLVHNPTNYTWFRWSITKSCAPENDTNGSRAQVTELGIWDGNGDRINGRLYPYTNYYSKAEGSLPEGMCAYWRPGTVYDTYSGNSVRPLEGIFDDGTPLVAGRNAFMSPKFAVSGKDVYMNPDNPSTWMPIVMHLTNGIGRAATFDVVSPSSNTDRNPKSFVMEGSLDGIHWDSLTNITLESNSSGKWVSSGGSYSAGSAKTHTGGYPIAGGPVNPALALANVESISVAEGARIVSLGGAAPIKGLTVDASGAGTIENFEFAESGGTLDVRNLPRDGATLPGAYVNCTGFGNIAGWTLKVGGEETRKYRISAMNGTLRVLPIGTRILFR